MKTKDLTLVASKTTADVPLWSPAALPEFIRLFGLDRGGAASEAHVSEVPLRVSRVVPGETWVAGHQLAWPVRVRIEGISDAALVVTHEGTGIHGVGQDLPSAVDDFRAALVEHRDVLVAAGPLSEELSAQLGFLQRHLRPTVE